VMQTQQASFTNNVSPKPPRLHFCVSQFDPGVIICVNSTTGAIMSKLTYALRKIGFIREGEAEAQESFFERIAQLATVWSGSTHAFMAAMLTIIVWGITGPIFRWSDTWQLVINTSTTIITFLMVFLIQRGQNKEVLALHIKLNELIRASAEAHNALINVEKLPEAIVKKLHDSPGSLP
jgi:low affinity Fe/Cu permease